MESVETSSSTAEVEPVQEPPIESKFDRIVYSQPAQGAISQVAKTSPGVEEDDLYPECCECFDDRFLEVEGRIKPCPCCNPCWSWSEPKLSRQNAQRAIAPAAKNSIDAKSDLNPILTGIPLSDKFLARYSPPQPEIIHFQSEADGQLSLLNFEIEAQPEPPDPDDFESLDDFRKAIARWDWEHPSSFDHCSDQLPSSEDNDVSSEDNDVSSEDNDVSSEDKPLELSLNSFCLWAHCPADWYESAALLELSRVMELSSVQKTSSTSDFFIPTFGRWGDRQNGSDEPPDTGTFARWPKPKPPSFPPIECFIAKRDNCQTQPRHSPNAYQPEGKRILIANASQPRVKQASRNYPETIPKLFHCGDAGSSTRPARSPPGGDARRGQ
jgi:hypothetical protein